jgi:hypothetical protein
MTHTTLPDRTRTLLQDLESIEWVIDEKHKAGQKAKAKEASASTIAKGSSKKLLSPGTLVNESQRRPSPASSASTARQRVGPI